MREFTKSVYRKTATGLKNQINQIQHFLLDILKTHQENWKIYPN